MVRSELNPKEVVILKSRAVVATPAATLAHSMVAVAQETPAVGISESEQAVDTFNALRGDLVPGIEAADPMIAARSAAYIVSLSRRAKSD